MSKTPQKEWPKFNGKPEDPTQMGYYNDNPYYPGKWYRMESEHGESNPVWEDSVT